MKKPEPDMFCPSNPEEWRVWLKTNHVQKDSVWLIIYKKSAANANLSWSEAVDHALCFGWIDSVKKTIDSEKYKQYFSKRKATSIWSRINKNKIEQLTAQGLMQSAGLKSIEIAKNNGSWSILDSVEALIVPKDLAVALQKTNGASSYYEGLSKSSKKMLLYWVISAKRPETREKRIIEISENAGKNQMPKSFR
ncbi:YdeI/OmpD-associated family protein [Zobellia alginiliquefaciens]|uniref:YdeI/OmpD-associated family protein n=1 Tax=Zobellia alginiliquefaciens TaxID=3032586 RepID=UPI0023E3710F|nr:YdeI/OmpD-associated family protein [Zobellia alginiliquefaciens]